MGHEVELLLALTREEGGRERELKGEGEGERKSVYVFLSNLIPKMYEKRHSNISGLHDVCFVCLLACFMALPKPLTCD